MNTLSELARVKAIFQQRAICAALGIMGEVNTREDLTANACADASSPAKTEKE